MSQHEPTPDPVTAQQQARYQIDPRSATEHAENLDYLVTFENDEAITASLRAGALALRAPSARAELEAVITWIAYNESDTDQTNVVRSGDLTRYLKERMAALAAGEPK
jgi:hypothetical protein